MANSSNDTTDDTNTIRFSMSFLARFAGVSNFDLGDLTELLKVARIKPAVVQRNSDPLRPDTDVQAFCFIAGIQYEVMPLSRHLL